MYTKNRRILIVDDNQAIHTDFRKILEPKKASSELTELESELFSDLSHAPERITQGAATEAMDFEVESAYQGQEAVARVRKAVEANSRYALAFVDMRMPPGWNGVKSIEEMWKVDPELQVVICTAYSDHSWDQIAERLGVTDRLLILKKPFDKIEVCQLALALTEKSYLFEQAGIKLEQLKEMVEVKTAELRNEIAERIRIEEELIEAKKRLQHQASFDDTTQMFNRRAIDELLNDTLGDVSTEPLALMFIDIDHFKRVNDEYGHAFGDMVLNAVSERLRAALRPADDVGRYGGEEFVVLLRKCEIKVAATVAERLRAAVAANPIDCEGIALDVTVSVGVAAVRPSANSVDEVLARADKAMYRAKQNGRNRVEIDDDTKVDVTVRTPKSATPKPSTRNVAASSAEDDAVTAANVGSSTEY